MGIQFQFLTPQDRKAPCPLPPEHAFLEGTLHSVEPHQSNFHGWGARGESVPVSSRLVGFRLPPINPGKPARAWRSAASSLGEGSVGCFTLCAENDCSLRSRLRTNGLNHESTLQWTRGAWPGDQKVDPVPEVLTFQHLPGSSLANSLPPKFPSATRRVLPDCCVYFLCPDFFFLESPP
jgi:hypothetical protein